MFFKATTFVGICDRGNKETTTIRKLVIMSLLSLSFQPLSPHHCHKEMVGVFVV